MGSDNEFDDYVGGLNASDQQALNAYMDNLDFENNSELDEYLDHIEEVSTGYSEPKREKTVYPDDVSPLEVSLLDDEPYVDTLRYKEPKKNKKQRRRKEKDPYKEDTGVMSVVITVLLILLIGGAGGYAVYHYTDGFKNWKNGEEKTEAPTTTEAVTTTEEVTEEPAKPYATVNYTLHKPHATENTIVFDSNAFSLKYPVEDRPIFRDDNGEVRDATQEERYPAITLTPVEGSLNSTNPDPTNPGETQQMTSRYMVLVDLSDDSIVAKRDSDLVVNPASMTKILTVLTAVDMIDSLDDTFKVSQNAVSYAAEHDCSAVGFLAGETVPVKDLIYGTIVCSGADAAVSLAEYCCGSQEAFVEKMNAKAEELGISETAHFTNVVGVYDENLHCTMEDMAVIISTAMQNDLLRDVLTTRIYQTAPDPSFLPDDLKDKYLNNTESSESTEGEDASSETATESTTEAATEATTDGSSEQAGDDSTTEEIDPGVLQIATEGVQISNWFMRRIEDKDTGGEVLGAKTGFVNAAGFCCASYYKSNSGKEYVCVTGDTYSSWRCIYDHVGIYRSLAK